MMQYRDCTWKHDPTKLSWRERSFLTRKHDPSFLPRHIERENKVELSSKIPRCEPRPERIKRCRKCKQWLPIGSNFDRSAKSPDFHASKCKTCKSERKCGYAKP